jgi:hypothetical protein
MKSRYWIYIYFLAMVILIVVLLRRSQQQAATPGQTQATVQSTTNASPIANMASKNIASIPSRITPPAAGLKPELNRNEKTAIIVQDFNNSHNLPIELYGQIIDQDNNPVPDVRIKFSIQQPNISPPTEAGDFPISNNVVRLGKETGSDGRFEVTGEKGDGVQIESIQKSSYLLSPKAPNHFGASSGSFANPVIFKMWKVGTKEPLIDGSHVFGIDSSKTYTLDLLNGKKIEGEAEGDLRVSVTRPSGVKQSDKYSWSFSIEAIQGGLLESDDEFMYLAPESGYAPKIEMLLNPDDATWTQFVKKQFFLRSRNGQIYGRVRVEVDAIYNVHSAIQIDYAINPNRSRNLQP